MDVSQYTEAGVGVVYNTCNVEVPPKDGSRLFGPAIITHQSPCESLYTPYHGSAVVLHLPAYPGIPFTTTFHKWPVGRLDNVVILQGARLNLSSNSILVRHIRCESACVPGRQNMTAEEMKGVNAYLAAYPMFRCVLRRHAGKRFVLTPLPCTRSCSPVKGEVEYRKFAEVPYTEQPCNFAIAGIRLQCYMDAAPFETVPTQDPAIRGGQLNMFKLNQAVFVDSDGEVSKRIHEHVFAQLFCDPRSRACDVSQSRGNVRMGHSVLRKLYQMEPTMMQSSSAATFCKLQTAIENAGYLGRFYRTGDSLECVHVEPVTVSSSSSSSSAALGVASASGNTQETPAQVATIIPNGIQSKNKKSNK